MDNDGQITFLDREWVEPGETVEAEIWLLCPEFQRGRLYPDMAFEVQEGNRRFGTGRILRVLDPELEMG